MSGLGSFNQGGNSTFLRIGMGVDEKDRPRAVIGKRCKDDEPGAVQVFFKDEPVLVEGKPIYRTEHAFVEGVVRKLEREQPEFNGKKVDVLNIHLDTVDGGSYALQLTKGDAYWINFALRCPNIDWNKPVRLTPYAIPQDDNPKYMNKHLVPSQGGGKCMKKWKMEWLREVPENFVADPAKPYPFIYDADESAWKKGKALNWLDNNPIEEAVKKVAFLNEQPAAETEKTALDAASETATARAEAERDPYVLPSHITGEDDDYVPH